MFKFSNNSIKNMHGVDQRLIDVAHEAIKLTKVDFGIPSTGGVRSEKTQKELYEKGVSKADGIEKISMHQKGLALDVFAYVDGKASWDKSHLSQVANAFLQAAINKEIKIEWGGLWKNFEDMPHFQLEES